MKAFLLALALLAPQDPLSQISSAERSRLSFSYGRMDRAIDTADSELKAARWRLLDETPDLWAAIEAARGLRDHASNLQSIWASMQAVGPDIDSQLDGPVQMREVLLPETDRDAITAAITPYATAAADCYQHMLDAELAGRNGSRGLMLQSLNDALDEVDTIRNLESTLKTAIVSRIPMEDDDVPPGPQFPDPWPSNPWPDATGWNNLCRNALQLALDNGPEPDGVYRAYLPTGYLPGLALNDSWVGPPYFDPTPFGDTPLEIWGHPDYVTSGGVAGSTLLPEYGNYDSFTHPTLTGGDRVIIYGNTGEPDYDPIYRIWTPSMANQNSYPVIPTTAFTGDEGLLVADGEVKAIAKGYGTSLFVGSVEGWSGKVSFHRITVLASGGNNVSIGAYCPTPEDQAVEDCRFYDCQFAATIGLQVIRPVSVNYAGVGFYDCKWLYADNGDYVSEHGVYTRNCLWLELLRCEIPNGIGGQDTQSVNRIQEFDNPCYTEPTLQGYVSIDTCLFVRPALHDERAGSAFTLAGSGWNWSIKDTIIVDDGLSKNHTVSGGNTYGAGTVYDGNDELTGEIKSQVLPNGKYNGIGLIDGLYVWFNTPNRSLLKIEDCSGAIATNCFISAGPTEDDTRTIDIYSNATPLYWDEYNDGGIGFILPYAGTVDDVHIPPLRFNGVTQGTADAVYFFEEE